MSKKNIFELIGRIEVDRIWANKSYDAMGEKYMGKKKYRAKKRKFKI